MSPPQKNGWYPSAWQIVGFLAIQLTGTVGYIYALDSEIRPRVTALETSQEFIKEGLVRIEENLDEASERIEGKLDKIGERIESLHR